MAEREVVETSEAQIAVHWQEEGYYHSSPKFIAQANMTDASVYERFSLKNFPNCFKEYADLLTWYKYWDNILDTSDAPCYKWFKGGLINASYNCVDRHLPLYKNKTAIHFVPELETDKTEHITYQELYVRVNEFAAVLKDCGLKAGDRVTLHMPMVGELPITMLACAQTWCYPLPGLRRVQRKGRCRQNCRLAERHPDNDGRVFPGRAAP